MTLIAQLTYDYPQAFEAVWVAFGITAFIFFSLAGTVSKLDKKTWYEGYIISLWCLGASILVLLASV